jgi:TPR repeat protein
LYDEALFSQPPKGDDCPICFILLPDTIEGMGGQTFMACCGKTICTGCSHEHELQSNGIPTCPFCRADMPPAKKYLKMMKKRVDANDSNAVLHLGNYYFSGDERFRMTKDIDKAVKLYHRAAELGSAVAYRNLGTIYYFGNYGLTKDEIKGTQYFEKAAMAGCAASRYNLGLMDANAGRVDRAIKHWLIAANCGNIRAVDGIKIAMTDGYATRDDYAQALRGYQQWVNEVKNDQRDRAATFNNMYKHLTEDC